MAVVPPIVGATIDEAVERVRAASLGISATAVTSNAQISAGRIAQTSPPVGTSVADNTVVSVVISSGPAGFRRLITENFQSLFFNLVAAGLLIWFAIQIGQSQNPLDTLADKDTARGLITFLITATAAALFIVMAVSTVVNSTGADDDKRFDRGKQVLTMLIGILGTIVGYYFGADASPRSAAATAASAQTAAKELQVADPAITTPEPKKGEAAIIATTITGGKAPYKYSLVFTPPLSIVPVREKLSSDGKISEKIAVPADLQKDTEVAFNIEVIDAAGAKANLAATKKILMRAGP